MMTKIAATSPEGKPTKRATPTPKTKKPTTKKPAVKRAAAKPKAKAKAPPKVEAVVVAPPRPPRNKAYEYAEAVVKNRVPAPKYVKKQARIFLHICDGKDPKYALNARKLQQINKLLKLMVMPRGLKAGQSLYKCMSGYQWLFTIATLCVVYRNNPKRRRYETAVLEIARKNFKTYTTATVFILLLLLEPKNSKFYSVAPDGSLSREVKDAIEDTLRASPLLLEKPDGTQRFAMFQLYIMFQMNRNRYMPLNYSNGRLDGKFPSAFLADEVGMLPNSYAIEAMRSGQLNMLNKLGCIISTKYPTIDNPFEDEVKYAKRVLDGIVDDDTYFALLYEPDKTKNWTTDDKILLQANPVASEVPQIWEDLLKRRTKAIEMESARQNFLTKHCNIIYQGGSGESYIDVAQVQQCRVAPNVIDWSGRNVYLGVDLSMTSDNCAVAMVAAEDENVLADVTAFIPEGRIEEKNKFEKLDYQRFIDELKCIACGNKTVDYKVIEDFVFAIEEKYDVKVMAIGYDRYNALSSAQKWSQEYNMVQIRQHSDTLHPPTKFLAEKVANGEFKYEKNTLLEINFQNARCSYDTNMNRYVHKKKSNGKVDMVVALINATYLLQIDCFINSDSGFVVQTG